jgi:hypothetical protein
MEIIKDINGKPLRLTRRSLTEMGNRYRWRLLLRDLVDGERAPLVSVPIGQGPGRAHIATSFANRRIGCRVFSQRTFNKILKATRASCRHRLLSLKN